MPQPNANAQDFLAPCYGLPARRSTQLTRIVRAFR